MGEAKNIYFTCLKYDMQLTNPIGDFTSGGNIIQA